MSGEPFTSFYPAALSSNQNNLRERIDYGIVTTVRQTTTKPPRPLRKRVNANRMWHLIAELVETYAADGEFELAINSLKQTLETEPMWVPNALFDPRTEALRDREDFQAITALPPDDAPAHFNATLVALEYGQLEPAVEYLGRTLEMAKADGSLPFLLEALAEDPAFQPYKLHSKFTSLLTQYQAG
ncbi:MAG: hypothetical protein O3A46_06180 [Candidatus Poribacteria bacterium]|nr:hypothetical protein [Candidatus Poribacteria bacterium]